MGRFILDFECRKAKVAVEIDGQQHFIGNGPRRDHVRDQELAANGYITLRYTTSEVRKGLRDVVQDIYQRTTQRLAFNGIQQS